MLLSDADTKAGNTSDDAGPAAASTDHEDDDAESNAAIAAKIILPSNPIEKWLPTFDEWENNLIIRKITIATPLNDFTCVYRTYTHTASSFDIMQSDAYFSKVIESIPNPNMEKTRRTNLL